MDFETTNAVRELDESIRTMNPAPHTQRLQDYWGRCSWDDRVKLAAALAPGVRGPGGWGRVLGGLADPATFLRTLNTAKQLRTTTVSVRSPRDRNLDGKLDVEVDMGSGRRGIDLDADGDIDVIEVLPDISGPGVVGLGNTEEDFVDDSDHWA